MSGTLLACALMGAKAPQTERPSGQMYIIIRYHDDNGSAIVALRHEDMERIAEILPDATAWVNVRADSYAQAMQRALRCGLST